MLWPLPSCDGRHVTSPVHFVRHTCPSHLAVTTWPSHLAVTPGRHTWPLPPGRYHLSCDGRHAGGLGGSRGIFLWGWSDQRTGSTARSPDGCAICQVRRVTSSRQRVPPRTLLVTHAWAHAWDARLLCNTGAERTPAHASPSRVRSRRPRVAHSLDGRLGRQKVGIARRRFAAGGARQQ